MFKAAPAAPLPGLCPMPGACGAGACGLRPVPVAARPAAGPGSGTANRDATHRRKSKSVPSPGKQVSGMPGEGWRADLGRRAGEVWHPVDLHKGYHAAAGGQASHRGRGQGRLRRTPECGRSARHVALRPRRDRATPGRRDATPGPSRERRSRAGAGPLVVAGCRLAVGSRREYRAISGGLRD